MENILLSPNYCSILKIHVTDKFRNLYGKTDVWQNSQGEIEIRE